MSGRRSRDKGARGERAIVRLLQAANFNAQRVPLSGAVGGRFAGDVLVRLLDKDLRIEAKARADGFKEIYSWLDNADALVIKADRKEALCVVRLRFGIEIAQAAERGRS
jgi:Holliday junction resolvase